MQDGRVLLIPIDLDRSRRLCFDMNAWATIHQETGFNVLSPAGAEESTDAAVIGAAFQAEFMRHVRSPGGLTTFLWAGLLHEDPELTRQVVGAMYSLGDIQRVLEAVSSAATASLPTQDSGGNGQAAVPSRRSGRTSGH